jgi:3-oxoacyl-[acyl-carrier protein] reductase
MFDLTGKKALVTGGSRGIGKGICLALAKQGAEVVINYVSNQEKAEEVKAEIEAMGGKAIVIQAHVGFKGDVVRMFEEVKEKWGSLDILVNNAGVIKFALLQDVTEEMLEEILGVNLKGQFYCAQEAVKLMGEGGRIINITSVSSGGVGIGFPMSSAYTASKGGIVGMTENLALELGPQGITVNAIAPGAIETDMASGSLDGDTLKAMLQHIPRQRIGQPEDIGAAAAFLASKEADYITGIVLYVDGGWLTN